MAWLVAAAPYVSGALTVASAIKKPLKTSSPGPIPMPDDEEIRRAKRRSTPVSRGRASTILTGTDYGLGG